VITQFRVFKMNHLAASVSSLSDASMMVFCVCFEFRDGLGYQAVDEILGVKLEWNYTFSNGKIGHTS